MPPLQHLSGLQAEATTIGAGLTVGSAKSQRMQRKYLRVQAALWGVALREEVPNFVTTTGRDLRAAAAAAPCCGPVLQICQSNYTADLLEWVDPENLPVWLGGRSKVRGQAGPGRAMQKAV
jgi:hypothetical protein